MWQFLKEEAVSLKTEYQSLRASILQLFSEQSGLVYVMAIGSAITLVTVFKRGLPVGLSVLVWELVLIGVGWNSIGTYSRLCRIAASTSSVRHQSCEDARPLGLDQEIWDVLEKEIDEDPGSRWKWGVGPRTDCQVLRLLGGAGLLLPVFRTDWFSADGLAGRIWFAAAVAGYLYLLYQTHRLYRLLDDPAWFEEQLLEKFGRWKRDDRGRHAPIRRKKP